MKMNRRIRLANFLVRLGHFIHSLPVVVMRPDDMIEFSRLKYSKSVANYSNPETVDSGLTPDELALLEKVPIHVGRILVLGMGGGREAISFARGGFDVTGVDFVKESVENAIENAKLRGLEIRGITSDLTKADLPSESFQIIWISMFLYSCIPTRKRRLQTLHRLRRLLVPGGILVCQFHWSRTRRESTKSERVKKLIARLTRGNTNYDSGDILFGDLEYRHAFSSADELGVEFHAAGFEVVDMEIFEELMRGGAILRTGRREGV